MADYDEEFSEFVASRSAAYRVQLQGGLWQVVTP